jgi:hypothetical protein
MYIGLRKKCTQKRFVQKTEFSGTELMTIFSFPPPPVAFTSASSTRKAAVKVYSMKLKEKIYTSKEMG